MTLNERFLVAKAAAIVTAEKRAATTGLTQYVGERYDGKLYVSKVKPSEGWCTAIIEPKVEVCADA